MSRQKALHKKDHLRLAPASARVAFTGDVVPGAFHVQDGRTRQRPQIASENYSPYLEQEEQRMQVVDEDQYGNRIENGEERQIQRFDATSRSEHDGDREYDAAARNQSAIVPKAPGEGTMFLPASQTGLAEAKPVVLRNSGSGNGPSNGNMLTNGTQEHQLALWEVEHIKEEAEQAVQQQAQNNTIKAQEYDVTFEREMADRKVRRRRRRWVLILLCIVIFIIVGIVVSLVFLLGNDDDDGPSTSRSIGDTNSVPTSAPTDMPSTSPTESFNATDTNVDCPNAIPIDTDPSTPITTSAAVTQDDPIKVIGTTLAALATVSEDTAVCGPEIVSNGLGMWYRFSGDNRVWTISTCNDPDAPPSEPSTTFDSQLTLFQTSITNNACEELDCRASNDQFCDDQSQVTFTSVVDKLYYIYIHGYREQRGVFNIKMHPVPQDHFSCDKAKEQESSSNEAIGSSYEMEEALRAANDGSNSTIPKLSCLPSGELDTQNPLPGLWYDLTGTGNRITLSTCSDTTKYDARISVVTINTAINNSTSKCGGDDGDATSVLQCVAFEEELCPTGKGRIISFQSMTNQSYSAIIHGPQEDDDATSTTSRRLLESPVPINADNGISGDLRHIRGQQQSSRTLQADANVTTARLADEFEFGLIIADDVPPGQYLYNPREFCQNASMLDFSTSTSVTVEGSIRKIPPVTAPNDTDAFGGTCGDATYSEAPGVWYQVVGNGAAISATTCDNRTNFDTQISVFSGDCQGALTCVIGNDQSACGSASFVMWQTQPDVVYRILVHGYGQRVGNFVLTVETDLTFSPTSLPSVAPSDTPSTVPSTAPTASPTLSPSSQPSTYPPTTVPSMQPSHLGSISPTVTFQPSNAPSGAPSTSPTVVPSATPSMSPSSIPSASPSVSPTATPSASPSSVPSASPSVSPSSVPTATPTRLQSSEPSVAPTSSPTAAPTSVPTSSPTSNPTSMPTSAPTTMPTGKPTSTPTTMPTSKPTSNPTSAPTAQPTSAPTLSPSVSPTDLFRVQDACADAGTLTVDGSNDVGVILPYPTDMALDFNTFQGTCSRSAYASPWGDWYRMEGTNRLTAIDTCSELTSLDLQITVFRELPSNDLCGNLECIAGNDTPCGLVWWDSLRGETYYIFIHPLNAGETGTYLLNLQDQPL